MSADRELHSPPLLGLRVVDLTTWIAGGYCSKLLADGGAEVVKVETPDGDPLRTWSASGAQLPENVDRALFNYLHSSQRSVVLEHDLGGHAALHDLLARADVALWSDGTAHPSTSPLSVDEIRSAHPHLIVAAITPCGLNSPWADRPVTEFTLQAWSGGVVRIARGRPERAPVFVPGQIGEWMAGLYAAIGVLAARRSGGGQVVDVSMLETLAATLTYYPVSFFDQLGRPIREDRFIPTPGVSLAKDGVVGLGTGTGQQWFDFCAMIGRPEWIENRAYLADRTVLAPEVNAWIAEHTVQEILELATAFRLPNSPVLGGADLADAPHMRERACFIENPRDGAVNPRPPCRFERVALRAPTPAPALGEHSVDDVSWPIRADAAARSTTRLPFEGLRVLDMTAFWAGPFTGHMLAMLGADVIHLESASRPDGARLVGGVPQTEDRYLERGPIFAALNTNKRSLTIDTRKPAGVELLKRYIATCDVIVENYTPRVLDQLGLDADALRAINPALITVRMPGFGLDGPWREVPAFAYVIEDASGFTWLSGYPDVPPVEPYSIGDPNAGLHALFGLQLALAHRDRTGEGGLVEAAMLDAALSVTAEQVIEHSAYGSVLERVGNRGPLAAPQGIYQTAGTNEYGLDDCWVAIAIETDEQWTRLVSELGSPAWATDADLATVNGRREAHDLIDRHLAEWCRQRSAEEAVDLLWPAGVPIAPVLQPQHQVDLAPLQQRGFFESLHHPVIGSSRYATLPVRLSGIEQPIHHRHAPLLGEHTRALLLELGLSEDELAALASEGVISEASD